MSREGPGAGLGVRPCSLYSVERIDSVMVGVRKLVLSVALAGLVGSAALARPEATPGPDTKWVVNDAEMVLVVNLKQLFASDLMKKGGTEEIKKAITANAQARTVSEATGIDPTKDIDSITVSGTLSPANPKDTKALVVVRGRFDQDKLQGAAEQFAKKHPDELKLLKEDKQQLYQIKANDQTLIAAFIDASTLVLTPSKEATLDAVKAAGRKEGRVHKVLQPAIKRFTGKESLALALVINEDLKKALEKAPQAKEIAPKIQSVQASLTLTADATVAVTINTEDAASAKKVQALLTQLTGLGQLLLAGDENYGPVAVELIKSIKMSTDEGSVTATLKVDQQLIEKAGKKDKDK